VLYLSTLYLKGQIWVSVSNLGHRAWLSLLMEEIPPHYVLQHENIQIREIPNGCSTRIILKEHLCNTIYLKTIETVNLYQALAATTGEAGGAADAAVFALLLWVLP